jgi:type IV secretion system protein TrbL
MRRRAGLVLALVGVAFAISAGSPSPALADVCSSLDTGPIPNPAQAVCDAGKAVIDKGPVGAVSDVVTAPIKAAGDEVMQGVTKWVASGASWLVEQTGSLIDETTTPRLDSDWFGRQYQAMVQLAAVFALPLLLLAVMQAVLRRDGQVLVRAVAVQLPLAFFLTAMAVVVTTMLLAITDQASSQVAASVGDDATAFFADVGKSLATITAATGNAAVPLFAVFLGGLVAAIAAFFVWIELLLRSAAVYVCVLFLPLTFIATIWPATSRWSRRLVELLVAIILSKFVIVAIMALAAAGLGQSRSDEAFQGSWLAPR